MDWIKKKQQRATLSCDKSLAEAYSILLNRGLIGVDHAIDTIHCKLNSFDDQNRQTMRIQLIALDKVRVDYLRIQNK